MKSHRSWLILIVPLSILAVWVALPGTERLPVLDYDVEQPLGLDLVGGLRVLMEAELPTDAFEAEDLQETKNNIERRVNALGLAESTAQVQGDRRILIEIPGLSDPERAIETLQETAVLEFVDFAGLGAQVQDLTGRRILTTEQLVIQEQRGVDNSDAGLVDEAASPDSAIRHPFTGDPFQTVMTGAGLQAAAAQLDPSGRWAIQFELNDEGSEIFGSYTEANVGQPMAIVLDGIVLSAPTIQARLTTTGTITGDFTEEEAKQLAVQLRSGALRIPLRIESQETVGATLGQESVELSIQAGVVGVIVVLAFMLIYYRVPGISADFALLVFVALNMALFKLIPITLTLPAITGFLISIGTAVDGNILIFERIKEELRAGKQLDEALDAGFDRAWNSIRDSNTSTIIIAGILFLFGQTPGASIVSGFAITLALGLILNLFTAVIVTRTFLHLIVGLLRRPLAERAWLLGI